MASYCQCRALPQGDWRDARDEYYLSQLIYMIFGEDRTLPTRLALDVILESLGNLCACRFLGPTRSKTHAAWRICRYLCVSYGASIRQVDRVYPLRTDQSHSKLLNSVASDCCVPALFGKQMDAASQ